MLFAYVFEHFSHLKMFLAGTGLLGVDKTVVTAFWKARRKPRKVSEASKREILAFTQASLRFWGLKQGGRGFPAGGARIQSPVGLEEP